MGSSARRSAVVAAIAVVTTMSPELRAEGRDVAARVVDQWRASGAEATLLPSRFLFDDEAIRVEIPAPQRAWECTHIAIVGARGLSFRAKLDGASNDPLVPDPFARASSLAGVLELRRCGEAVVRQIFVASEAGRGAVEIVVARSQTELPPLVTVIPERTGGALPPIPDVGSLPALVVPERRAELAETRARRDGGTVGTREVKCVGNDGVGDGELMLDAGCHRVEVFARDPRTTRPGRRFRLDVDAELRDPDDDRVLARDRTEAPDARLEACLGESAPVTLVFAGAPPDTDAIITVASWPLPLRLPAIWGPRTRGRMARVVFTRHVAMPSTDPIFLAQGGSGTTPFSVPVEAGACYVAVVGATHGHPKTLQLRTIVGTRESTDERGAADEAALNAFCIRSDDAERGRPGDERARVEVFLRGSGSGWALAVFRVKSGVWEAGR